MSLDSAASLEVVYYGTPVPRNLSSLTFLGLIFDRIHFPNVYLPQQGFDLAAAGAERQRLEALPNRDFDTQILINVMRYLEFAAQLKNVCHFAGSEGQVFGGINENEGKNETREIVTELDRALFGPRKEGVIPVWAPGYHKALPGGEQYIDYPGPLFYPATALLYAAKRGLPVVNDQPGLPVPSLGGEAAKNNAKILSTVLAIECASLVLPKVKPLHPLDLVDMREALKPHLIPFRLALLSLAKELNGAITRASTHEEIVESARFLVQTEVTPRLVELRAVIEKPSKPWYTRAFDLAKQVPELATTYATMPIGMFAAKALGAIGGVLVDVAEGQKRKQEARCGMYYLLKLKEVGERTK